MRAAVDKNGVNHQVGQAGEVVYDVSPTTQATL
jgi:hypothetical protein